MDGRRAMRDIESTAIVLARECPCGAFADARRTRLATQVSTITDLIFLDDPVAAFGFRCFFATIGGVFVRVRPTILTRQENLPLTADGARKMERRIGQTGNRISTSSTMLRVVVRHDTAIGTARSRTDALRRPAFAHTLITIITAGRAIVQAAATMLVILNLADAVTAQFLGSAEGVSALHISNLCLRSTIGTSSTGEAKEHEQVLIFSHRAIPPYKNDP